MPQQHVPKDGTYARTPQSRAKKTLSSMLRHEDCAHRHVGQVRGKGGRGRPPPPRDPVVRQGRRTVFRPLSATAVVAARAALKSIKNVNFIFSKTRTVLFLSILSARYDACRVALLWCAVRPNVADPSQAPAHVTAGAMRRPTTHRGHIWIPQVFSACFQTPCIADPRAARGSFPAHRYPESSDAHSCA